MYRIDNTGYNETKKQSTAKSFTRYSPIGFWYGAADFLKGHGSGFGLTNGGQASMAGRSMIGTAALKHRSITITSLEPVCNVSAASFLGRH
jgi:hypothetical protein